VIFAQECFLYTTVVTASTAGTANAKNQPAPECIPLKGYLADNMRGRHPSAHFL
jgi:hypothetical protein